MPRSSSRAKATQQGPLSLSGSPVATTTSPSDTWSLRSTPFAAALSSPPASDAPPLASSSSALSTPRTSPGSFATSPLGPAPASPAADQSQQLVWTNTRDSPVSPAISSLAAGASPGPVTSTSASAPIADSPPALSMAGPRPASLEVRSPAIPSNVGQWLDHMHLEEEAEFAAADRVEGSEAGARADSPSGRSGSFRTASEGLEVTEPRSPQSSVVATIRSMVEGGTVATGRDPDFGTAVRTQAYTYRLHRYDEPARQPSSSIQAVPSVVSRSTLPAFTPDFTAPEPRGPPNDPPTSTRATPPTAPVPAASTSRPAHPAHPTPPVEVPHDWYKVNTVAAAKLDLWVSPPPLARLPLRPSDKVRFRLRPHSSAREPAALAVGFVGNSTVVTTEHRDCHNFLALSSSILPVRRPGIELDPRSGEYEGSIKIPKTTNCACGGATGEAQGRWRNKALPGSFTGRLAVVSYQFEVRITRSGRFGREKEVV